MLLRAAGRAPRARPHDSSLVPHDRNRRHTATPAMANRASARSGPDSDPMASSTRSHCVPSRYPAPSRDRVPSSHHDRCHGEQPMAILRAAATRGAAQDTTAWLGDVRRANHEYGLVDRPFALRSVQNIAPLGGGVGTRLPRPSTSHSNTSNDQVLRSPLELRGGAPVQTVHGVAANVGGVRLLPGPASSAASCSTRPRNGCAGRRCRRSRRPSG